MKKYILKSHKFALLLLIIFVLASCNRAPERPNTQNEEDNSPKLPKILTELEDEVLKIMYDLDSVTGLEKAIEQEKLMSLNNTNNSIAAAAQSNESTEEVESEDPSVEESEETESSQEDVDVQELIKQNRVIIPLLDEIDVAGSFAEKSDPPSDINTVWDQISASVTQVHKQWNVLEAQLTPVNVPRQKLEEFEKVLDDLTLSVMSHEKLNSLKLANELTRITTEFRSYFGGVSDHGVYGMYYNIRSSILSTASNNYTKAIEHLDETTKIGSSLRQELIKNDSQDILQKFELSIEDLRKQLEDKNFHLSQIKAPIVIKNIKLMQDEIGSE